MCSAFYKEWHNPEQRGNDKGDWKNRQWGNKWKNDWKNDGKGNRDQDNGSRCWSWVFRLFGIRKADNKKEHDNGKGDRKEPGNGKGDIEKDTAKGDTGNLLAEAGNATGDHEDIAKSAEGIAEGIAKDSAKDITEGGCIAEGTAASAKGIAKDNTKHITEGGLGITEDDGAKDTAKAAKGIEGVDGDGTKAAKGVDGDGTKADKDWVSVPSQ